ncbi:MAG TPA: flagellar hook-associated protein FlgK [Bryobacteraceae bacterium]|jgi:flagellar hook-associated protein 1 FlgK|nr:flagellar hook-associated protein FlgK [Bryobacteraceae bacterium]
MSNLLASLNVTAGALNAFDMALQTTQNNVANAQTPGYAKQTQTIDSVSFNLQQGSIGGVSAGASLSSRNEFAEQNVHNQNTELGSASQSVNSLTQLQNLFPVADDGSGIASAMNGLFSAFSSWAESPNNSSTQQVVLNNATTVANAFNSTAQGIYQFVTSTNSQISQTVNDINNLTGQLAADNYQIQHGGGNDAGLDANLHNTLDQLSQYVNFSTMQQSDGTYTVLVDGQTPLVIGSNQYSLSASMQQPTNPTPTNPNAPPLATITSSSGADITSQVNSGQLGSLLTTRNTVIPSYIGDAYQSGSLNTMAQQFADRVNNLLTSGNVSDGPPAQTGTPLFTYDATNATNAAASLSVNPSITGAQLAAIQPGPPEVANGTALALAGLANPQQASDEINGQSYTQYYANIASSIGSSLTQATDTQSAQQTAVAQAQNLRQQASGVDLNEEAATLVQFQNAYQANSRFITVIDNITSDLINMINTAN